MLIVLLLLLVAVAAAALALLWLVVRGHNKRLLLAGSHAVASDTPDGIGISVLCSGVRAQEQVENLLSAEYAHYEVIVVLDSLRYPVEFAAFTARYRMIRVEYVLSEELPVTGVRRWAFAQAPFPQASAGGPCAGYSRRRFRCGGRSGRLRLRAAGAGGAVSAAGRCRAAGGRSGGAGRRRVRLRAFADRRACRAAEPRSRHCSRRFRAPSGQIRTAAPAPAPLGAGFLCAAVWAQAVSRAAVRAARRGGCVAGRRDRRRRMDGPVAGGRRTAHRSPRVVRRRMCFAGPQRYCLRAYGRRRKGAAAPL